MDMTYLEDCLMAFVSWPVNKVRFENPSARQHSASTDIPSGSKAVVGTKSAETSASKPDSQSPMETATRPSSPVKKSIPDSQSPIRKSQVSTLFYFGLLISVKSSNFCFML